MALLAFVLWYTMIIPRPTLHYLFYFSIFIKDWNIVKCLKTFFFFFISPHSLKFYLHNQCVYDMTYQYRFTSFFHSSILFFIHKTPLWRWWCIGNSRKSLVIVLALETLILFLAVFVCPDCVGFWLGLEKWDILRDILSQTIYTMIPQETKQFKMNGMK